MGRESLLEAIRDPTHEDHAEMLKWVGGGQFDSEAFELARISHQVSTAAADPGMSTALRLVGLLDVPSSTPAESSPRAPCSHARLHRLATKPGEKCGLESVNRILARVCL